MGTAPLGATRFRQMAGRAGRKGFQESGECIIVAKSPLDIAAAEKLIGAELPCLQSSLTGEGLTRAVLEVISLGLVQKVSELESSFIRSLFRFHQLSTAASAPSYGLDLRQELYASLSYLLEADLVRVKQHDGTAPAKIGFNPDDILIASPVGDGVVSSSLKPVTALEVFEDLRQARGGIHLDTDLHLLFLATPTSALLEPNWQLFLIAHERLSPRERTVAKAVGVTSEFIVRAARGWSRFGRTSSEGLQPERERTLAIHRRFWTALALSELLAETPLACVAEKFQVPRGALQCMQAQSAQYCNAMRQFCVRLRWYEMAALFEAMTPRVSFGASPDILPLCRISGVFPKRARALLEAGLSSIELVACASEMIVEKALRSLEQFESMCAHSTDVQHFEKTIRLTARKIIRAAQELLSEQLREVEAEAEDACLRFGATVSEAPVAKREH